MKERIKEVIAEIKSFAIEIWVTVLFQIIIPAIVSVLTTVLTIRIWKGL